MEWPTIETYSPQTFSVTAAVVAPAVVICLNSLLKYKLRKTGNEECKNRWFRWYSGLVFISLPFCHESFNSCAFFQEIFSLICPRPGRYTCNLRISSDAGGKFWRITSSAQTKNCSRKRGWVGALLLSQYPLLFSHSTSSQPENILFCLCLKYVRLQFYSIILWYWYP